MVFDLQAKAWGYEALFLTEHTQYTVSFFLAISASLRERELFYRIPLPRGFRFSRDLGFRLRDHPMTLLPA